MFSLKQFPTHFILDSAFVWSTHQTITNISSPVVQVSDCLFLNCPLHNVLDSAKPSQAKPLRNIHQSWLLIRFWARRIRWLPNPSIEKPPKVPNWHRKYHLPSPLCLALRNNLSTTINTRLVFASTLVIVVFFSFVVHVHTECVKLR